MTSGTCRGCGADAHAHLRRSRPVAAGEFLRAAPRRSARAKLSIRLHAYVCDRCFLVQLEEFESPEAIFSDYAYFSGFSTSWLQACRSLCGRHDRALRLGPRAQGGRGRQQRRLSAAIFRGTQCSGARRRAGRQRRRGRDRQGRADRSHVFRRGDRRAACASAAMPPI